MIVLLKILYFFPKILYFCKILSGFSSENIIFFSEKFIWLFKVIYGRMYILKENWEINMLRKILFNDEITLWWELSDFSYRKVFFGFVNGVLAAESNTTHLTFHGLAADTEYEIKVVSDRKKVVFDGTLRTAKSKRKIDVTKAPYDAVGDGKTMNTVALQRALSDCDKDSFVYIPKGVFLTGSLKMHSDSELYIEKEGVLQGTETVADYLPKIPSRFEGIEMLCYSALINMGEMNSAEEYNCNNVVIRGGGAIIGGGKALQENVFKVERKNMAEFIKSLGDAIKDYETSDTIPGRARPRLINVSNGENIVITGVSIGNGPAWNLHILYSRKVTVYGCKFFSQGVWNGDGCDPDSSTEVAIFDCDFKTGDDCIAVKSGKNPEGNIINRKCADVYVFDCRMEGHSVAVGSEMSGGVENVCVWDCDMSKTVFGLYVKGTKKRGGYVKDIRLTNCVLPSIMMVSVPFNDDGVGADTPPTFSDFYFNDCKIIGGVGDFGGEIALRHVLLCGFGEDYPIRNVYFYKTEIENLRPDSESVSLQYVENFNFDE